MSRPNLLANMSFKHYFLVKNFIENIHEICHLINNVISYEYYFFKN